MGQDMLAHTEHLLTHSGHLQYSHDIFVGVDDLNVLNTQYNEVSLVRIKGEVDENRSIVGTTRI
jgi:hypothetical protein